MTNTVERLTVDDLLGLLSYLEGVAPTDLKNHEARKYYLALIIFGRFLGDSWVKDNLLLGSSTTDFFKVSNRDEHWYKNQERVTWTAEMLFNFQDVEGFDHLIKRLNKEDIESVVAEVQAAAITYSAGFHFRFREDLHDLDILFPNGQVAAEETKCKIETTALTSETVRNAVAQARSQLPNDRPGFVFVKIPEKWVRDPDAEQRILTGMTSVFRTSKRITSLFFWWEEWSDTASGWRRDIKIREERNPRARFDPGLFKDLSERSWAEDLPWVYLDKLAQESERD